NLGDGTSRASARQRPSGGRLLGSLFCNLFLEQPGALGEFGLVGLGKETVEPAAMLDRTQTGGGNAQPNVLVQRLRHQRQLLEVRQEPAPGLVVGMAYIVAGHDGLAGQFTSAGHLLLPSGLENGRRAPAMARGLVERPLGKS